jgi:tetratricopeptide (TPR) repeat protein
MVLGLKQLKLAAGILAGVAKAGDQTGIATAIDLALKATDFGETLRKQDPVAVALRDVSAKLEEATRKALSGEFGADWESKPDLAATLAALPDVLEFYAPSTDEIFAENLDPERIARRATDAAETAHDDLFRRNTVGERLLFAVVRQTYAVALADKDFALQMILRGQGETLNRLDETAARIRRLEELLSGTAAAKGVPEAPLRAVLDKLGETRVPLEEIPARLAAAADELIRLRADLTRLRDDRPEFATLRARAAALIDKGEFDAARAVLREGREAARALRKELSRSEAEFLADEARVNKLQLDYDAALENFAEASRLDPDNCWIWIELGDLWILLGSLVKAEQAFRAALKAALVNEDERDLSVSHERIGDVQVEQGNLPAALSSYQASHAIRDRLAKADPGNAGWQRDLALSYGRIAMVVAGQGDGPGALSGYRQGREIIARLSMQSPDNVTLRNDLIWFDGQIGGQAK